MKRLLPVLALLVGLPAAAADADRSAREIAGLLRHWDTAAAGRLLGPALVAHPGHRDLRFLRAQHDFLRGRYAEASDALDEIAKEHPRDMGLAELSGLYRRTARLTTEFKSVTSPKGHFVISFQPGVDEVLVGYAGEALEKAYERLGDLFQFRPAEPVRVEILGRITDLAATSPLKVTEIEASGTIALCKYNRLMIVSPRNLVYGYEWLDTLAHEYIHLLVTRRSHNTVPIWLHEGMARFFQNRWRQTTNATLEPTSEDLLARAVRARKLIRFEAMSPSMAKLPTQEDTALAFAEVFMVMELLYDKVGVDGINRLLDLMRDGRSDREAVSAVAEKSFRRFQREWRNYLFQRNLKTLPVYANNRLLFRDGAKPTDELEGLADEARDFAYLGDRLAVKRRYRAASKEYTKGLEAIGGPQPIISAKLAGALLKQGRHRRVPQVVTPALELNTAHVLLYLYRGKARLALGRYELAHRDLTRAIRINPFDPEVHDLMARALDELGRSDEAEEERRLHRLVTQRQ